MVNKRRCFLSGCAAVLLALLLSGCADTVKNMRVVPPERVVTAPERGKSMVVFMRPSAFGVTIESSIFEIKEDTPSLIGTLVARQKISYQLEPGKHLFMVAGNNIDYLSAELKPNKTYYARIAPIMGKWIGRFEIAPIPINRLYSARFKEQLRECEEVEKVAAPADGGDDGMAAIQARHEEYSAKWANERQPKKPRLLPRDGK